MLKVQERIDVMHHYQNVNIHSKQFCGLVKVKAAVLDVFYFSSFVASLAGQIVLGGIKCRCVRRVCQAEGRIVCCSYGHWILSSMEENSLLIMVMLSYKISLKSLVVGWRNVVIFLLGFRFAFVDYLSVLGSVDIRASLFH